MRCPSVWFLGTLLGVAVLISYADRSIISTTIISMAEEYAWNEQSKGTILSSFFIGYGITQIIGGYISDIFDAKFVASLSLFLWCTFTIVTPISIQLNSIATLVIVRVALGLSEGLLFPSIHSVVARYIPREYQSRVVSGVTSCSYLGVGMAFIIAPLIMESLGWRYVFWIAGACGLFWLPFWICFDELKGRFSWQPSLFQRVADIASNSYENGKDKTFGNLTVSGPFLEIHAMEQYSLEEGLNGSSASKHARYRALYPAATNESDWYYSGDRKQPRQDTEVGLQAKYISSNDVGQISPRLLLAGKLSDAYPESKKKIFSTVLVPLADAVSKCQSDDALHVKVDGIPRYMSNKANSESRLYFAYNSLRANNDGMSVESNESLSSHDGEIPLEVPSSNFSERGIKRVSTVDIHLSRKTLRLLLVLFKQKEVWAIIICQYCQSWGMYGILSWLPTYLHEEFNISLNTLAILTSLPYVGQSITGLVAGFIADALLRRGKSIYFVRVWLQTLSMMIPAGCLLLIGYAAKTIGMFPLHAEGYYFDYVESFLKLQISFLFVIGTSFTALSCAAVSVSQLDFAPQYAGLIFGIGNTFGIVAGIIAVQVTGLILEATGKWEIVFFLFAVHYIVGDIAWACMVGVKQLDLPEI